MSHSKVAERMHDIAPFRVMDFLARAQAIQAAGGDVVHMEVGEPDFPAPPCVMAAAQVALNSGYTHYTPALGLPALRQAIADYYQQRFGLAVDSARVVVTPGASGALQLILSALVNPGDQVLLQDPGYPCNRHMVSLLGGKPEALPPMREGFSPELAATALNANTKAVMLASPANPTGEVIPLKALAAFNQSLAKHDGLLIVDEIYQGLQYEGEVETALSLNADNLFVINSFSKYFGMTGFRLGWAVVPDWAVDALERLAQNLFLAPPTVSQHAALAAFNAENLAVLEQRREIFKQRRAVLRSGLGELGFDLQHSHPQGAFYIYAGVQRIADDGLTLSEQLLEQAGVAITPGVDFGNFEAEQHVRFAYTTDIERLETGLERIGRYLRAGA